MAGMSLLGASAFLSGLDEMTDTFSSDSDGYRVGSPVEYGPYVEFGTARMPAQPYFRPSMDATRSKLPQLAAQASGLDEFMRLAALDWERGIKSRVAVDSGNLRASWQTEPL